MSRNFVWHIRIILILISSMSSPEEIVSHYLTSIDPDYLSRKLSFAKYVKATCTVLISAILIAFLSWNLFLYNAHRELMESMPANEETTIEYIN